MTTNSPETMTPSDESGPAPSVTTKRGSNLIKHESIEQENFDLVAKVLELITIIGWDDDDTYTFSDGERWAKFDPEGTCNEEDGS